MNKSMFISLIVLASILVCAAIGLTIAVFTEDNVPYANDDNQPTIELPEDPNIPADPNMPSDPSIPDTPSEPDTPDEPSKPVEPDTPTEPDVPSDPGITEVPDVPVKPVYGSNEEKAKAILSEMTLQEKIYQLFIVTQDQLTGKGPVTLSGENSRKAILAKPVGGLIYFEPNLVSRNQTIFMLDNIQKYSKLGLFIAVDEEGGLTSRLAFNPNIGNTQVPNMQEIGETKDSTQAYSAGQTIGSEIAKLGFNLNFAPVADVFTNPNNQALALRSFGNDPQLVASMVSACVKGMRSGGVLCTLKHFPGHGSTAEDSHNGSAVISKTMEELQACDLIPFKAGIEAGAQFVMVGHLSIPAVIGNSDPATLSSEIVTDLLKNKLDFKGIIITDSMQMKAITDHYSSSEAAVLAILAGNDMILMPENLTEAVEGIEKAIADGVLTEDRINESVLKILTLKISNKIIK